MVGVMGSGTVVGGCEPSMGDITSALPPVLATATVDAFTAATPTGLEIPLDGPSRTVGRAAIHIREQQQLVRRSIRHRGFLIAQPSQRGGLKGIHVIDRDHRTRSGRAGLHNLPGMIVGAGDQRAPGVGNRDRPDIAAETEGHRIRNRRSLCDIADNLKLALRTEDDSGGRSVSAQIDAIAVRRGRG